MGALFSRRARSRRDTLTTMRSTTSDRTSDATTISGSFSTELFQQFYSKLVESLPMDDVKFIAKLYSNGLLPGDLRNKLKLLHRTSADKATLFLDSVIEPSVTSDGGKMFDKLLNVMEDSEYDHVKELARIIRTTNMYTDNG